MQRINTGTKAVDLHGSGKHGFVGTTSPGTDPTDLSAAWCNGLQEELLAIIEAAGLAQDGSDLAQALQGMRLLAATRDFRLLFDEGTTTSWAVAGGLKGFVFLGFNAGSTSDVYTIRGQKVVERSAANDDRYAVVYAPTNARFFTDGSTATTEYSDDDGETYSSVPITSGSVLAGVAASTGGVEYVVFVGGTAGYRITADGSSSWDHTTFTAGAAVKTCAASDAANPVLVYAGAGGEIGTATLSAPGTVTARTAANSYAGTFKGSAYGLTKQYVETSPGVYELQDVGVFVLVGTGGEIQWSDDNGATWNQAATSLGSDDFNAVAFFGNRFYAVGDNGAYWVSADGDTWEDWRPWGTGHSIVALAYDGRRVCKIDADGKVFVSGAL